MKTTCSICHQESKIAELHTYNGKCEGCFTDNIYTPTEGSETDDCNRTTDLRRVNGITAQYCGGGNRVLRNISGPGSQKMSFQLTRSGVNNNKFQQKTREAPCVA